MKPKPIVYVAMNTKGGVGKSSMQALLYYTLRKMGVNPLIIALDINLCLLNQIRIIDPENPDKILGNPDIFGWDINSVADNRELLPSVVQAAIDQGRPIIIDIPAKAGKTQGIYNVLRSGALRYCNVIGIAPVREGDLPYAGAIEAYEDIKPQRWIKVLFSPETRSNRDLTQLEMALSALKPAHSIRLALLDPDEAKELGREVPVPLPQLEEFAMARGPAFSGLLVIADYWKDCYPKIEEAIRAVTPELFAKPAPASTPAPAKTKQPASA